MVGYGENGSVIGPQNLPTSSAASGVWSLGEMAEASRDSIWPQPSYPLIELIATVSGTTTVSSITFASIPQTYRNLRIVAQADSNTTSAGLRIAFGTGGGAVDTTDSNYQYVGYYSDNGSGSSSTVGSYRPVYPGAARLVTPGMTFPRASGDVYGVAVWEIPDYVGTTLHKTITGDAADRISPTLATSGVGGVGRGVLKWDNTGAIDQISFDLTTGSFADYYHFKLYGWGS